MKIHRIVTREGSKDIRANADAQSDVGAGKDTDPPRVYGFSVQGKQVGHGELGGVEYIAIRWTGYGVHVYRVDSKTECKALRQVAYTVSHVLGNCGV